MTHAPNIIHLPTARNARQVQAMPAGQLFRVRGQADRILVRLTHAQLVADASTVWCVVVAAHEHCELQCGALCSLPRETAVEPLHTVSPLRVSVAH